MTGVLRLAPFQRAAADLITQRLRDRKGSRRFLLADEVGLGKTLVARGVIEAFANTQSPLRVVYLCSNAEIAEQNRKKLDPSADRPVGRVTELALSAGGTEREIHVYSFTPGTSLREGTGLSWERKLILYLLGHLYGENIAQARWRNYFRCGVKEDPWHEQTKWKTLQLQFHRKTTTDFKKVLRAAWSDSAQGRSLVSRVRDHVPVFDDGSATDRAERNRLVAELRKHMQRVALTSLAPNLVILDEVQRFRDVLDNAADYGQLTSELFRSQAPVLILSATPYRLLTLDHEVGEDGAAHYEDFFRMLRFLFHRDGTTPARIEANLKRFAQSLRASAQTSQHHTELLAIKTELEEDLRKVVCRTERNWYVADYTNSVRECGPEPDELPSQAELTEYFTFERSLSKYLDGHAQVTEFWKSAPSLLSFLDAGYGLLRKLRDEKALIPERLLSAPDALHKLVDRNQRMRHVVRHALGESGRTPPLWTAPCYTYHRDQFFGNNHSASYSCSPAGDSCPRRSRLLRAA